MAQLEEISVNHRRWGPMMVPTVRTPGHRQQGICQNMNSTGGTSAHRTGDISETNRHSKTWFMYLPLFLRVPRLCVSCWSVDQLQILNSAPKLYMCFDTFCTFFCKVSSTPIPVALLSNHRWPIAALTTANLINIQSLLIPILNSLVMSSLLYPIKSFSTVFHTHLHPATHSSERNQSRRCVKVVLWLPVLGCLVHSTDCE